MDFDLQKIQKAIENAAQAVEQRDQAIPFAVAKEVFIRLEELFDGAVPSVEQIQDIVKS